MSKGGESSEPFDHEAASRAYKALQTQIKDAILNTGAVGMTSAAIGRSGANRHLRVSVVDVAKKLDEAGTVGVRLSLSSIEHVSNVRVSVECASPVCASPLTAHFSSIGSVAHEHKLKFYVQQQQQARAASSSSDTQTHVPHSLDVRVCVSYVDASGTCKVSELSFHLPLRLVMRSAQLDSGRISNFVFFFSPKWVKLIQILESIIVQKGCSFKIEIVEVGKKYRQKRTVSK